MIELCFRTNAMESHMAVHTSHDLMSVFREIKFCFLSFNFTSISGQHFTNVSFRLRPTCSTPFLGQELTSLSSSNDVGGTGNDTFIVWKRLILAYTLILPSIFE